MTRNQRTGNFGFGRDGVAPQEAKLGHHRAGGVWQELGSIKSGSRLRVPTDFGQIRHLSSIYLNFL